MRKLFVIITIIIIMTSTVYAQQLTVEDVLPEYTSFKGSPSTLQHYLCSPLLGTMSENGDSWTLHSENVYLEYYNAHSWVFYKDEQKITMSIIPIYQTNYYALFISLPRNRHDYTLIWHGETIYYLEENTCR